MRRRMTALAGIAAFVVVVGGIAVLAGSGSSPSHRAGHSLPLLPGAGGTATGAAEPASASAALAPYRPVDYVVKATLPALASTASAYRVGPPPADAQSRLAAAFGSADGQTVTVEPNGFWLFQPQAACQPATATATNGSGAPDAASSCAVAVASTGVATAVPCPPKPCPAGSMCAQVCSPPEPPARPADLPSKDQAEAKARDLLDRAGLPTAGATVHVDDGFTSWTVRFDPTVDGVPTIGLGNAVTIGPKGAVLFASGHLGPLDKIGDYPLAGVDTGLARLRSGQLVFGGPRPLGAATPADLLKEQGSDPSLAAGAPPASPDPAQTVPPPPPVNITGVHLGLVLTFSGPDKGEVVPVYVFETAGNPDLPAVPAVVDRLLGKPAEPPAQPGQQPGQKGRPGG